MVWLGMLEDNNFNYFRATLNIKSISFVHSIFPTRYNYR